MNIYLDIETVPTQRDDFKEKIAEGVSAPKTITKAETLAKWEADKKPGAVDEVYRKTALNGTYGEIICICWAIDDEEVLGVSRTLEGDEGIMLEQFYSQIAPRLHEPGKPAIPCWIGHYITEFDLRFIWHRSVVNNIKPSFVIPYAAKPWSDFVFDTKIEWTGLKSTGAGTLDDVCTALDIPGKGDLDGSKVWGAILEGRYDEVFEYCKDDVEKVRQLHKRMTFQI